MKNIYIFLFWLADVTVNTLMKKYLENLKFKKKLKIKSILAALVLFFAQKLHIISFLQMISLHKIHFHVHYEEVHPYKRFQKFSIKTLTRIGYPNFINEQKTGQSNLGVKPITSHPHTIAKVGCYTIPKPPY